VTDPREWIDLDRRHVWHPYTQALTAPPPLPVVRAEGVWLHGADGRKVLDGISSWWVNIHGHSHPRLLRAIREQAEALSQVVFAGLAHEPAARLAAELSGRAPGNLPRVFFSDDGSTAVEAALKMAIQLWRNRGERHRRLFVSLEHAYHGDTFGAMAAGGVSAFREQFGDLLFEVRRARAPCCELAARGAGLPCGGERSPSIEEGLERDSASIAAVIIEPILQGAGGMKVHPPAFLRRVRELTAERGIPLIADEVLTGFGRTGTLFACEQGPVEPDILCLSKAITGGCLPLGATLATEEIHAAFLSEDRSRAFLHGHSYTANALACAAALESLRIIDDEGSLARVKALERIFAERLDRIRKRPPVRDVRGVGAIAAVEIEVPGEGGYLDEIGPALGRRFLERGILLRPLGNVIYFMPPYPIAAEECHRVFDVIEEEIARCTRDAGTSG
jgi:adenosylmethionine-8-amino-7-oxononanoate aminotransferase